MPRGSSFDHCTFVPIILARWISGRKNISDYFNDNIDNILNNNSQINKFINTNFYSKNIISQFISSKIIRSIINNLFVKTTYTLNKDRIIIIYSKNDLDEKFINKIDSILNFFDYLTNKKNYFMICLS